MREILFRGKRKVNEEWVYGFPFVSRKGEYKIKWYDPHYGSAKTSEVHPNTVGQFIGLTDNNKKKIFEGDVINSAGNVVKFCNGSFCANGDSDLALWTKTEVIGNIYDNPELR